MAKNEKLEQFQEEKKNWSPERLKRHEELMARVKNVVPQVAKLMEQEEQQEQQTKMSWDEAMKIWKNLPKEEHDLLRQAAVRQMLERGCDEIGTSDVNHEVYKLVSYGDYKEAIKEQRLYEDNGFHD